MPDELHLMLQVTDVLTQNLIKAAIAFGWKQRTLSELVSQLSGNKCPHSHQMVWCDF